MTVFTTIFDLVLALLTIGIAWRALNSHSMRDGVALFIALGVLVSLIWVRLEAPDLAIAEVAIGSGITGALLMAAMHDLPTEVHSEQRPTRAVTIVVSVGTAILVMAMAFAFLTAVDSNVDSRLQSIVMDELVNSGVSNPVTAVLLNYRSYDTLLELVVLIAAAAGIRALGIEMPAPKAVDPILNTLIAIIVPALVLTSFYLLWVGAHAPGGAFQAGSVLAAAIVLSRLAGRDLLAHVPSWLLSWSLVLGALVFLTVGLIMVFITEGFLQFPPDLAGALILVIEFFAMLSIAAALVLAFAGGEAINENNPLNVIAISPDTEVSKSDLPIGNGHV
ncbi:MAG: multisubunit Na+/H+ antiporter MnhB subunit [Bacteroidia bacterium]|jgi:multisubunit Na+/H+ antiporter MnhB subunit